MSGEAKRRGGKRLGAGRKPSGRIKRDVSLPSELWEAIEAYRLREGIKTTGEALERLARLALAR